MVPDVGAAPRENRTHCTLQNGRTTPTMNSPKCSFIQLRRHALIRRARLYRGQVRRKVCTPCPPN
jgi:hypothetical protein